MTIVYTKPNCQACMATKRHLKRLGVAYVELPIDDHALKAAHIGGFTAAPIVRVDNGGGNSTWWGGYRPDAIDRLAA